MSHAATTRAELHDLPIPTDVRAGKGWTSVMLEMAAHIGEYATLQIVDVFGGTDPYIPLDPSLSPFTDLIGKDKAEIMSSIYGRTVLQVPVAGEALRNARRAGVLAAIRAKQMTLTEAARIRGVGSRSYISHLVNHTRDGEGAIPVVQAKTADPRQMVMFGD
jgi:hypothetical protein